jgi:hypothetical protein
MRRWHRCAIIILAEHAPATTIPSDTRTHRRGSRLTGAISTALVLEMEDGMLISQALNRVLVEFYEVGGAAVVLVLAWAMIATFIRGRRRTT